MLFPCPPHDFSERLKIWNFGKNKKVFSQWVDVQQKKNPKKVIFWPLGRFSRYELEHQGASLTIERRVGFCYTHCLHSAWLLLCKLCVFNVYLCSEQVIFSLLFSLYHTVMLIINEIDLQLICNTFIFIINISNVLARGPTTSFVFVFTVLSVCAYF